MKATLGGLEYLVGTVKSGLLLLLIGEGLVVRTPERPDSISALMAAVRFFTPRETLLIFRRRVMTTISRIGRMTHTTRASRHSIVNMTASAPTIVSREIIRSSGPWCASSVIARTGPSSGGS